MKHLILQYTYYDEETFEFTTNQVRLPLPDSVDMDTDIEFGYEIAELDS